MDRRAILADLTRIDFQKTNRIRLGTSYSFSVGGIGDVRQSVFRFKHYRFDEVQNRIFPVLREIGGTQMNNHEASILLERLLEGVHPITGEILPDHHACNDPQVLRALYKAINALRCVNNPSSTETPKRTRQSCANNQNPWTQDDDIYLRNACPQGIPINEMCSELRRSKQKVKLRLVYLGLADRSILGNSIYPKSEYAHQGLPWYPEDEKKLTVLYNSGLSPKEMSTEMKRSINSIMCRLEKLGLIESRHKYTAPDVIPF